MTAAWKDLATAWGKWHGQTYVRLLREAVTSRRLCDFATATTLTEAAEWHRLAARAHARSLVRGAK
jgi:hypothetical protein